MLKFIDRADSAKGDVGKRFQRDMEDVYVKMLDRRKRKAKLETLKKKIVQSVSDDESEDAPRETETGEEFHVPAAEIYKRAFDELRKKEESQGNRYDEDSESQDSEFDERKRDVDTEEWYVDHRKRRSADKFSLDDSPFAGIIQSLSITLYGTAN